MPICFWRRLASVGLGWLLLAAALFGQDKPESRFAEYQSLVDEFIYQSLTERRSYKLLRELCETAPHRLSGSPGAASAVEWARQTMIELGFENVRLEPCTVPHWDRGQVAELRFAAPAYAASDPLPILALGGSVATPENGINAEVLRVRSFEELKERRAEAPGKIVFFDVPMSVTMASTFSAYSAAVVFRSRGAIEAAKAGAVAAIVRSMTTRLDDSPHTGGMSYQSNVKRIPTAAVSTLGAERIARLIENGETVRLFYRQDSSWKEEKPSHNVIGELRGREKPEEIVLVGGHLDGWDIGEGAHDDGSGVCHSLGALDLIAKLPERPRRTIRCVLFMNEENGLAGARAYYDQHRDEMPKHVLALESDRGGFSPRGFSTDSGPEGRALCEEIAKLFWEFGASRIIPGGGGADISFMRQSGVPLVGFVPDPHRYFDVHHSERDVFAQVNDRELCLGTACIAAFLYIVAELPETFPRNSAPGR